MQAINPTRTRGEGLKLVHNRKVSKVKETSGGYTPFPFLTLYPEQVELLERVLSYRGLREGRFLGGGSYSEVFRLLPEDNQLVVKMPCGKRALCAETVFSLQLGYMLYRNLLDPEDILPVVPVRVKGEGWAVIQPYTSMHGGPPGGETYYEYRDQVEALRTLVRKRDFDTLSYTLYDKVHQTPMDTLLDLHDDVSTPNCTLLPNGKVAIIDGQYLDAIPSYRGLWKGKLRCVSVSVLEGCGVKTATQFLNKYYSHYPELTIRTTRKV